MTIRFFSAFNEILFYIDYFFFCVVIVLTTSVLALLKFSFTTLQNVIGIINNLQTIYDKALDNSN